MIKNCLKCDNEFYTKPARVKIGKGKYCSKKCYDTRNGNNIQKTCPQCLKVYEVQRVKNVI